MKGFSFLLLFFFLFSCTATKITSSWTAPSAGANDYNKIMVVSVIQNEDSTMRRKMEAHMVADLKAIGYNAVAFEDEFTRSDLRYMRYDSVRRQLSRRGVDGVVIISLMAKEKETVYVKDKGTTRADNLPLGGFWNTPTTVRQDAGKPGYYVTTSQYYWQSNFYDVRTVALLYSAKSTAFEVTSAQSLAHKYGKVIVDDMQKNYLLTAKKSF